MDPSYYDSPLIIQVGLVVKMCSSKNFVMKTSLIFFLILIGFENLVSQKPNIATEPEKKMRIAFYNAENLFDIYNDSLTNDDEFTPEGMRHWDNYRFYAKINNLSKVIIGIGEWNLPAIVGLCEVENEFVLKKLIYSTPLSKFDYRFIHFESPDPRGIDVAMLYRKSEFKPLIYCPFRINFPVDTASSTRDILYVKGIIGDADTLHVFVNHWPSRYGGYLVSKPKRAYVAEVLKSKVDSILNSNNSANILIMGDFNDGPDDESLVNILKAKKDTLNFKSTDLINLIGLNEKKFKTGTNKYREQWSCIDQLIVSGNLLLPGNKIKIAGDGAHVYDASYLLEEDEQFLGVKMNRTYVGPVYHGGYSDHLPVYLDVESHFYEK